jgi:transposase
VTKQRRSFSQKFKFDSAKLVLDDGYSLPEAARSLEVGETALRRWVKQWQEERGGGTIPNSKALTPEQQKTKELEAKVNQLEREKIILKKTTVICISLEVSKISAKLGVRGNCYFVTFLALLLFYYIFFRH